MFQQLAVTTVLWVCCLVIAVDARRNIKKNVFTGDQDPNSSPEPIQDFWLYEGDIKLTDDQTDWLEVPKKPGENDAINSNKAFFQGKEEKRIWHGGVIPYVIDCSLKNMPGLVVMVKAAMKHWESKTCVTFKERKEEKEFVKIFRGTHCYSTVGRVSGSKLLSIGHGCEYHNVILHELGHVIGFWHEQSRPDRDDHVRVLWRNILSGWETAFVKLNWKAVSTMMVPYDFSSIMHYPFNAFAKNSRKRTIVPLKPVKARPYKKLSELDILRARILYNCPGHNNNVDVVVTQDSSSIAALRRKRAVHVEEVVEYSTPRKQRSARCKNTDSDEVCEYWAERGFCITRQDFMLTDCMKSCNACTTAKQGEHPSPTKNPHYQVTQVKNVATMVHVISDRERMKKRRDTKRKARKEIRLLYRKRNSCKDTIRSCAYWARRGICEARPDFMLKDCRKSCNKCYPDPQDCVDRDPRCRVWATKHYCRIKKWKTVMASFCVKSCNLCKTDNCKDKEFKKCPKWKSLGFCNSRDDEVRKAMTMMCQKSCRVCVFLDKNKSYCTDKFKTCHEWSKLGFCTKKEQFMNKYCRRSCKNCVAAANYYGDCLDNSIGCEDLKAQGMCNKDRTSMFVHCKKTCGFCVKPKPKRGSVPCKDKYKGSVCSTYARIGYCQNRFVIFMIKNCKKTCGLCGGNSPYVTDVDVRSTSSFRRIYRPCNNIYTSCGYWARIGMCKLRPDLMLKDCRLACKVCLPEKKCENKEDDDNCKHWARLGKCTKRPNFMISQCPKTCNACPSRPVITKPEKPIGILCQLSCKTFLEKGFCSKWKNRCKRTCLANGCDSHALVPEGSCSRPMGAGWDFSLPDSAFNASSSLKNGDWDFGARNARLYKEDDPLYRRIGGWCAKESKNQWLQVNLGRVRIITAVATQGRDKFFEHVKSYQLAFSNDGKNFYKYKVKGATKILQGNCDHFTPVVNQLHRPYAARFVRFYPHTYINVCMRVEVYGCNRLEGHAQEEYGRVIYPDKRKYH